MADVHSTEQRSRNMAAVRGTNTKPELRVRSLLHRMGLRFRLYAKDLLVNQTSFFVHAESPSLFTVAFGTLTPVNMGAKYRRHGLSSGT